MEKYSIDTACTGDFRADLINSAVLAWADDVAEKLTEQECFLNGIRCYDKTIEKGTEVLTLTDEAQDIFNKHYDEQVDSFYKFANRVIQIEQPTEEEKVCEMLGNFTSMDVDEALEIWNSLTADNDDDMADDHFDMWEKVENSFTIKQLFEQI